MCKRTVVIMLALIYICGCQSSDPYVRRSELRKESKQIAQAQASLAVARLDEKVNTTIAGLTSATERNVESISSLESELNTFATQNAKAFAQLKSAVEAGINQNNNSIKQNAESVALLESTVNDFIKQNVQLVGDVRTDLKQLEEQTSQFQLDVHQQFSQREADRVKITDQLAQQTLQLTERVNQLDNRLQKAVLSLAQPQQRQAHPELVERDSSRTPDRPPEPKRIPDARPSRPTYHPAVPTKTENFAYARQDLYQLSFAAIGPLVILSGPIVAELYARKQKKLAHSLASRLSQIPVN